MIRRHALAFPTTLMLADGGLAICLALLLSILRFGRNQALPTLDYALPDARAMESTGQLRPRRPLLEWGDVGQDRVALGTTRCYGWTGS